MAKKPQDNAAVRPARTRPTGLDRFAVPEPQARARTAHTAAKQQKDRGRQSPKQNIPAARREGQPRTQASQARRAQGQRPDRPRSAQKLTPQKQGATQRPLGGGRTGRERSLHLRKIVRRKERRARLSKLIAVVLSLVCGIFALTAFFRVDSVEVMGLTRYQTQDVLNTFGVKQGDNLFFCDSLRGKKRLIEQYPYFESVSVERDLPNRMILHVTESQPIAAVNGTQGGWFILDKNCRVLERTDQSGAQDAAEVMGLRTAGGQPGQPLPAENPNVLEALKTLANGLDKVGLGGKATLYNLEDLNSIWILYEQRFAVCVGNLDNLDHKLALLQALVTGDQFTPSDKGSINLALGDRAITNTSLSAGEVERTARGQAVIEHIDNPQDDEQSEKSDESENQTDGSEEKRADTGESGEE